LSGKEGETDYFHQGSSLHGGELWEELQVSVLSEPEVPTTAEAQEAEAQEAEAPKSREQIILRGQKLKVTAWRTGIWEQLF
jgi:hypothetical protein